MLDIVLFLFLWMLWTLLKWIDMITLTPQTNHESIEWSGIIVECQLYDRYWILNYSFYPENSWTKDGWWNRGHLPIGETAFAR